MTFLRGRSTSYTRFAPPSNLTSNALDRVVQAHEFRNIPEDELESTGFCSYRNLLDSSVDRGFMEGQPDLWLTGLRRDVKKAPTALVQAQTARALADARQTNPNLGKTTMKEIKDKVRYDLNRKAQPRPAHAAMVMNFDTGLGYVDGVASAHDWLLRGLEATGGPFALSGDANAAYLAWCAWRAGHGVDTPVSPTGDITFREPKDAGASFDGLHNINALLDYWMGEQRATIASIGLVFDVEHEDDSFNAYATLQAAALKVCSLEFPEDIVEWPGTLDEKLSQRIAFVMSFERALAQDYKAFAELWGEGKLPEGFLKLIGEPAAPEAAQ